MPLSELIAPGEVWLVGAGPGDPDLLTRKAEKLITAADVVFYDALVGPGVLDLIPEGVERVSVGKRSGRHSKDQQTIDQMLVAASLADKRVVRLKGGDPAMFARASEEMAALRAVGATVRICPGITAASAVAASAGLSLSLRGVARRVQFITAHSRRGQALDLDWKALADPACTLAVYMGREAAPELSRALIAAGLPGMTPALIACDASLPQEQRLRTRLDLLPLVAEAFADDRPTLILIGEAVTQADMQSSVAAVASNSAICQI
ncbi:uroporphyrinogen-III C-methyltransferase [Sphingobium phenoxybenzoativorans]|uniref:uroporphyrinogen-III C-methyltransferase n=1 Tax=Sphingobium phenoxybenzoativorans TaxID=1592790 RepID=A0A975Q377_9SPHN|nr:uroporphyrinogen-III C-methyltransferase [Sphingobium phenoxybenzoativorans]QUT07750.1 uroporphyrinogen-III C-methyltransferase [Sphingobium phenoxybenzoativorans]